MGSDSAARHRRHSLRLKGYDYAQPGAYFVTLCTHNRVCSLGVVATGQMQLNDWGRVAAECWAAIPVHFARVTLDEWVIMPNHVHAILMIMDAGGARLVGAQHCCAPTSITNPNVVPGSLGALIRSYKSAVTKRVNLLRGTTTPPVWQRNYYEHVIRNKPALNAIRQYICHNPAKWNQDRDNVANGLPEAKTAGEYVSKAKA